MGYGLNFSFITFARLNLDFMKKLVALVLIVNSFMAFCQKSARPGAVKSIAKASFPPKINDSVAALIPHQTGALFGFSDQKGRVVIKPQYSNVGFFTEDCNLLNSPKLPLRKYGTADYASVRMGDADYRIDARGTRVYRFKKEDLGRCPSRYKKQLYHAFLLGKYYGIIEDDKFVNPGDYRQYKIYPQYDYLHVMEGDDLKNPVIVAVKDGKFGVIDVNGKLIIPFDYQDIKMNYSWKIARLFQVSADGKAYYFVDASNYRY